MPLELIPKCHTSIVSSNKTVHAWTCKVNARLLFFSRKTQISTFFCGMKKKQTVECGFSGWALNILSVKILTIYCMVTWFNFIIVFMKQLKFLISFRREVGCMISAILEAGMGDTLYARGGHIFQKSKSHLQILSARRVAWSMCHSENPHSEWPMNLMVLWYILLGACEMTDIFVCMRKNETNNYAENLTCHGTKLSHSNCIPQQTCFLLLLLPSVELTSLAFPWKCLFLTIGQARDCHNVIGQASL